MKRVSVNFEDDEYERLEGFDKFCKDEWKLNMSQSALIKFVMFNMFDFLQQQTHKSTGTAFPNRAQTDYGDFTGSTCSDNE